MTAHTPALVERVADAMARVDGPDGPAYTVLATAALDASGHAEMVAALEGAHDEVKAGLANKLDPARFATAYAILDAALAKGRASEPTR